MINNFTLATLKLEVAPRKVIHINFKGKEFIFKSLSKKEYAEIVAISGGNKDEADTLTLEFASLYPKEYDFRISCIAGLCESIAPIVVRESLVIDPNAIKCELDNARNRTTNLESQCFIAIKSAMPEISKEKFDNMSWQEILELVALSEQIMQINHNSLVAALKDIQFSFKLNLNDNSEPIGELDRIKLEKLKIKELWENGIDPATYYNIPDVKVVDKITPIILTGGRYWNRSDVLDVIRREDK